MGALVFIFSFGLYALTASIWRGYDAETAAVAVSLVEHGDLQVRPGGLIPSDMGAPWHGDRRLYSRAGLTQPLLEVPFFLVGRAYDSFAPSSQDDGFEGRRLSLYLYTPFIAAVAVVAFFALVLLRRRSLGWAVGLALLFGVASIAWPYAKVGMDTTAMTMVLLSFWAAAWTGRTSRPAGFVLLGLALAAALNTKPTAAIAALPALALVAPSVRQLDRRRLVVSAAALAAPLLAGLIAIGWYNAYRTGSITNFADPYWRAFRSTPLNLAGLFVSPGKGLLFYSPLVIFGILGARSLWRADRPLAIASLGALLLLALPIAMSAQWSDETWGPRYIVPVAWTLLLPIAWWATTRRRAIAVMAVGLLGLGIQATAVASDYAASVTLQRELTDVPVFVHAGGPEIDAVPYGDDGPRWIAPLSGVVLQAELVGAWAKAAMTGDGFVVTYSPYEGRHRAVDLNHPDAWLTANGSHIPDFWWALHPPATPLALFAILLGLLALAAVPLLARATRLAISASSTGPMPPKPDGQPSAY